MLARMTDPKIRANSSVSNIYVQGSNLVILNDSGKNLHNDGAKTRQKREMFEVLWIVFAIFLGISRVTKIDQKA